MNIDFMLWQFDKKPDLTEALEYYQEREGCAATLVLANPQTVMTTEGTVPDVVRVDFVQPGLLLVTGEIDAVKWRNR